MYRVLVLQLLCLLVAVLCGAAFGGMRFGLSAALGGLAYFLPNVLFVFVLQRAIPKLETARALLFLCGEFVKLILTMLALLAMAWLYPEASWGAVVMGLALTLQANFLVFLVKP